MNNAAGIAGILRISTGIMAALFLFAVAVQYNDPDPLRWMTIYGAAALACILALMGRLRPRFAALVGLVALVWAVWWAPGVLGRVAPGDLFHEMEMARPEIEEAREMVGLLLVAVWMAVLSAAARQSKQR
jgi:hypothetical protein